MSCMIPQTGNIRLSDGTLIGYRDPDTGVFTPSSDFEFVEDIKCGNCDYSTYIDSEGAEHKISFVYGFENSGWEPAVGPMHFEQDYLKASFSTVNIADGTDRFMRGKIKLDPTLNSTVMLHNYTGADNVSPSCRLQYEVANGIRGIWFDDNNNLKGTTDWIAVALDVELTYNFVFNSSSTMNLTINGVSGIPRPATSGGACNVFAEYVGAYSATLFRAPMKLYECDSCIVGFSNTVNRLPPVDGTNVISTTTDIDRLVTDNDPYGIWYPYIGEWTGDETGAYHKSDTPCDDSLLLLDDDNIALTDDNGNFLFGDTL